MRIGLRRKVGHIVSNELRARRGSEDTGFEASRTKSSGSETDPWICPGKFIAEKIFREAWFVAGRRKGAAECRYVGDEGLTSKIFIGVYGVEDPGPVARYAMPLRR